MELVKPPKNDTAVVFPNGVISSGVFLEIC